MCLDTITKRYDPPDMTEREAWKIFKRLPGGGIATPFNRYMVEKEQWLESSVDWEHTHDRGDEYTTGFHVFTTKQGADALYDHLMQDDWWADMGLFVAPVKVRGVRYVGTDATSYSENYCGKHEVLVADEMFVPE